MLRLPLQVRRQNVPLKLLKLLKCCKAPSSQVNPQEVSSQYTTENPDPNLHVSIQMRGKNGEEKSKA